jgi:hypothetical protein
MHLTARRPKIMVSADGTGTVSQASSAGHVSLRSCGRYSRKGKRLVTLLGMGASVRPVLRRNWGGAPMTLGGQAPTWLSLLTDP